MEKKNKLQKKLKIEKQYMLTIKYPESKLIKQFPFNSVKSVKQT